MSNYCYTEVKAKSEERNCRVVILISELLAVLSARGVFLSYVSSRWQFTLKKNNNNLLRPPPSPIALMAFKLQSKKNFFIKDFMR
jgi:hypothetical protein